MKKGYAQIDFRYKNCFDGRNMLNKDLDPKVVLDFKKGDLLPEILAERLLKKNPDHVIFEKPKEVKKAEPVEEKPKEVKVLSRAEIFDLTKVEQEKLLKERGIKASEIKKLKYEEDRVKKILATNPKE